VCFVVLHSSQDHLRIGMRDLDSDLQDRVFSVPSWSYETITQGFILIQAPPMGVIVLHPAG
jgi:hypothetical protein